ASILDRAGPGASHPATQQSLVWLPRKRVPQALASLAEPYGCPGAHLWDGVGSALALANLALTLGGTRVLPCTVM
ncbi:hypothetical protein P7K49_013287, partial [Saguinus oedipus]